MRLPSTVVAAGLLSLLAGGCGRGPSAEDAAQVAALEARIAALEQRKERIEDVNALERLQAAYGYYADRGLWDEAKETAANERWNARIGEAIKVAEAQPAPAVESIFDGVYASLPWNLKEQRDWLVAEGGGHAKDEGRFPL